MKKGIYIIKNKVNSKVYIGQSKKLRQRYSDHIRKIKAGTHHNEILQRAFEKYGIDSFEYSILEEVSDDILLNEREKYWIDFYGGINCEDVYNLKDPLLSDYSDYVKSKLSKSNSGENNPNYGHEWTEEMKQKASELRIGKTWEERFGEEKAKAAKEKLSNANKGRKHSEETKQKLRELNSGEKGTAYGKGYRQLGEKNPMFGKPSVQRKPIIQLNKDGEFIKEYEFITQVKDDGFNPGNVCAVLNGKLKSSGGFVWKYKE